MLQRIIELQLRGELVFIFVDDHKDRIQNLESEISNLSLLRHFKVYPKEGEFAKVVGEILNDIELRKRILAPTFAFIDPFGFSGVPFSLVQRLLKHPRSEAFITFMVDAMNRFLETPDDNVRQHIVEFFGTEEVLNVASLPGDRKLNLLSFYLQRLGTMTSFVRLFEMRDKNDRTIYYLVFASNNPLGHQKMKEAMWKVDSEGDFRYSDATNPDQTILFRADHSKRVYEVLKSKFSTMTVPALLIKEFLRNKTVYIDRHLSESMNYAEANAFIEAEPIKANGKKRKPGTFPDESIITFK